MSRISIRDLTQADFSAWGQVWQEYLAFYEVDLAPEVTAATWARLIDPASVVKARIADFDGRLAGFAIHMHHPSTWVMGDDCYLEDLCVSAAVRGQGIGRALIDDLMRLSKAKGWHRLYWHTNAKNARARALYDSYVESDGHIRYRLAL